MVGFFTGLNVFWFFLNLFVGGSIRKMILGFLRKGNEIIFWECWFMGFGGGFISAWFFGRKFIFFIWL